MSRRDFVKAAGAVPLAASLPALAADAKVALGEWSDDAAGLPCYRYTGPVPFVSPSSKISAEFLPADPFFLLGNYRLTLMAHASGMLQILSGERAWGRLNQGTETWSGDNQATLEAASLGAKASTARLVGTDSAAARDRFNSRRRARMSSSEISGPLGAAEPPAKGSSEGAAWPSKSSV